MADMKRREIVRLIAIAPLAAAFDWTPKDVERARGAVLTARRQAATNGIQFEPQFFTSHEYDTVRILVDLILPADDRSGSATDAGVPAFMDFIVADQEGRQTAMRGGLAWIDVQCRRRFERTFVECTDEQRAQVLDDIAWPDRARPQMSHGVAFFNSFRDLTASGFWSSRMGVEDLQYQGNVATEWVGCPEEQLRRLGVTNE